MDKTKNVKFAAPTLGLTNKDADDMIQMDEKTVVLHLLERCVDGIENQFKNVLMNHETDFMAAYRGHMTRVKKELEYLKNK